MNNLSLNELIDYSLGFDSETKQDIFFENMSIESSKELAYNEIQRRSKIYYEDNQIGKIVEKLNFLKSQINSINSSISIIYDYYDNDSYQIMQKIKEYSSDLYAPGFKKLKIEIFQLFSVLDHLWDNDPEYLRYTSKFWNSQYPQPYISSSGFELDLLFTKDFCCKINNTYLLSTELLPNTLRECKNADVLIFPLFLSNHLKENEIFEFLLYYQIMKWKYSTIIFIMFHEDNENRVIKIQEFFWNRILEYYRKNVFYFEKIVFNKINIKNHFFEGCNDFFDILDSQSFSFKFSK